MKSLWSIKERLSLFKRCRLQQLPIAIANGSAEGEDRADGSIHIGCACSLFRLFACRPLRRGDHAARASQGAPGQRPCRDGGLRFPSQKLQRKRLRCRPHEDVRGVDEIGENTTQKTSYLTLSTIAYFVVFLYLRKKFIN